jgi:hypothetical protein
MKGTAFTYFTTDNAKSARELLGILREAKADIPSQLEEMGMYGGGGGGRGMYSLCGLLGDYANMFFSQVATVVDVGAEVAEVAAEAATAVVRMITVTARAVVEAPGGRHHDIDISLMLF